MSENEIQQTPADAATERAVEAHITGQTDKAAPLFKAAEAAHRAAPPEQTGRDPGWRDGNELAPMPPPPAVTSETDAALTKFSNLGGEHAALIESWGSREQAKENIEYARAAFREMAATNPALIAAADSSGMGNSPVILEHLARFGRLSAGQSGDHSIARRHDMTHSPRASSSNAPRGPSSAESEMQSIMDQNPPGTKAYNAPAVQKRLEVLARQISGGGDIVGRGGRGA